MTGQNPATYHATCPACHLPITDEQKSIPHEGRTYHQRCAPVPEIAGKKDNIYPDKIAI